MKTATGRWWCWWGRDRAAAPAARSRSSVSGRPHCGTVALIRAASAGVCEIISISALATPIGAATIRKRLPGEDRMYETRTSNDHIVPPLPQKV